MGLEALITIILSGSFFPSKSFCSVETKERWWKRERKREKVRKKQRKDGGKDRER
jgi:hypothetical protein